MSNIRQWPVLLQNSPLSKIISTRTHCPLRLEHVQFRNAITSVWYAWLSSVPSSISCPYPYTLPNSPVMYTIAPTLSPRVGHVSYSLASLVPGYYVEYILKTVGLQWESFSCWDSIIPWLPPYLLYFYYYSYPLRSTRSTLRSNRSTPRSTHAQLSLLFAHPIYPPY